MQGRKGPKKNHESFEANTCFTIFSIDLVKLINYVV
jgi:hypothetical protein